MAKKKNRFEFESEDLKAKYIKEIINFFRHERDEEIGIIAAEKTLGFFFQVMGEEIYKKAIKDCKKLLQTKFEDIEAELDILSSDR